MPIYEYQCKNCGAVFEKPTTVHEHERGKRPICPKCKSHNVQQRPSHFEAVTSHKS